MNERVGGRCFGSTPGTGRCRGQAGLALPADGLQSRLFLHADLDLFPQSYEDQELLRLIYYGGIQHEIRKAVWPFLLGHYQFGMTEAERKEVGMSIALVYPGRFPAHSVCVLESTLAVLSPLYCSCT